MVKNVILVIVILTVCLICPGTNLSAAPSCAYCHKVIEGQWLVVDSRTYHPNHFICTNCRKPIVNSTFYQSNGRYYDSICYANFISERCEYCSKPILGEYVTSSSRVYHASCFNDNIGKRCVVCNDVVLNGGLVDVRGYAVCDEHHDNALRCYSCSRFVSPSLNDGSSRYDDGRVICAECRSTAVDKISEAEILLAEVLEVLGSAGIEIDQDFKLDFVSYEKLKWHTIDYQVDKLGVTLYKKTGLLGGLITFKDFRIEILTGLPRAQLRGVIAHELMHVWQFKNAPHPQDTHMCEGTCQYAAYLVMKDDYSDDGRFFLDYLRNQPDSIYGDSFRKVFKEINRRGLAEWLEYLRINSQPPW